MITGRLPLALPPNTSNPALYLTGLLHIAPIYTTFEARWTSLIASEPTSPSTSSSLSTTSNTAHSLSPRTHSILTHLYLSTLSRSRPLASDIKHLSSVTRPTSPTLTPSIHSFAKHILSTTSARPHVLVAYAWVFYMALFAGGRHLRAELLRAGPKFWRTSSAEPSSAGLALFHFPGEEDGEDVKAAFRARFAAAETALTVDERRDVVSEAREVFRALIAVVEDVDALVADADARRRASLWVRVGEPLRARAQSLLGGLAVLGLLLWIARWARVVGEWVV